MDRGSGWIGGPAADVIAGLRGTAVLNGFNVSVPTPRLPKRSWFAACSGGDAAGFEGATCPRGPLVKPLAWLCPTDHRRAAGVFLIATFVMLAVGSWYSALVRANLASPSGAVGELDAYNRWFALHGLVAVYFAVVPLLPTVAGLFLLPRLLGVSRVALPWLLPFNCYAHVLGCVLALWALAPMDDRPNIDAPARLLLSQGLAAMQLSLALVSVNLLATLLLSGGRTGIARMPVFAWAVGVTAVATLALHFGAITTWFAMPFDVLPKVTYRHDWTTTGPRTWDSWPPFDRLLSLTAGVLAFGLLLQVGLNERDGRRDRLVQVVAHWLAVSAVLLLGLGHIAGTASVLLDSPISALWVLPLLELPGLALVAVAVVVALVAGLGRRPSLGAPVLLLVLLAVLLGHAAATVAELWMFGFGYTIHLHDTHAVLVPIHLRAAGIALAFLAGLYRWWPNLTDRRYLASAATFGAILFAIGAVGLVSLFGLLGYEGMPRRYPNYPAEFERLNQAATGCAALAAVGCVVLLVVPLASLTRRPTEADRG